MRDYRKELSSLKTGLLVEIAEYVGREIITIGDWLKGDTNGAMSRLYDVGEGIMVEYANRSRKSVDSLPVSTIIDIVDYLRDNYETSEKLVIEFTPLGSPALDEIMRNVPLSAPTGESLISYFEDRGISIDPHDNQSQFVDAILKVSKDIHTDGRPVADIIPLESKFSNEMTFDDPSSLEEDDNMAKMVDLLMVPLLSIAENASVKYSASTGGHLAYVVASSDNDEYIVIDTDNITIDDALSDYKTRNGVNDIVVCDIDHSIGYAIYCCAATIDICLPGPTQRTKFSITLVGTDGINVEYDE